MPRGASATMLGDPAAVPADVPAEHSTSAS